MGVPHLSCRCSRRHYCTAARCLNCEARLQDDRSPPMGRLASAQRRSLAKPKLLPRPVICQRDSARYGLHKPVFFFWRSGSETAARACADALHTRWCYDHWTCAAVGSWDATQKGPWAGISARVHRRVARIRTRARWRMNRRGCAASARGHRRMSGPRALQDAVTRHVSRRPLVRETCWSVAAAKRSEISGRLRALTGSIGRVRRPPSAAHLGS